MKSKLSTKSLLAVLVAVTFTLATTASAKVGAAYFGPLGVAPAGSPYRYVAVSPSQTGRVTVVERIARDGGWLRGWWTLHGDFQLPPMSFNGSGTGVSADGNTLVLSRFSPIYPPRRTELAILDTRVHPRHPHRGRNARPLVTSVRLKHSYTVHAISPHGTTIYLDRHLSPDVEGPFQVREMRTGGRRGASPPLALPRLEPGRMAGAMLDQVTSADARWTYTLYGGKRVEPFVYALDTIRGRARRADLPGLAQVRRPFDLALRVDAAGRSVEVLNRRSSLPGSRALLTVDTATLDVSPASAQRATGGIASGWLALLLGGAAAVLVFAWATARRRALARKRT
jgi:hypothetical protein